MHGVNYIKFVFMHEIPGMQPTYCFLSITTRLIFSCTVSDTVSLRKVRNQNRALKIRRKISIQLALWIESLAVSMYWCVYAAHCLSLITVTVLVTHKSKLFFLVALRPNAGHGLTILEVSRSHTTTHYSQ